MRRAQLVGLDLEAIVRAQGSVVAPVQVVAERAQDAPRGRSGPGRRPRTSPRASWSTPALADPRALGEQQRAVGEAIVVVVAAAHILDDVGRGHHPAIERLLEEQVVAKTSQDADHGGSAHRLAQGLRQRAVDQDHREIVGLTETTLDAPGSQTRTRRACRPRVQRGPRGRLGSLWPGSFVGGASGACGQQRWPSGFNPKMREQVAVLASSDVGPRVTGVGGAVALLHHDLSSPRFGAGRPRDGRVCAVRRAARSPRLSWTSGSWETRQPRPGARGGSVGPRPARAASRSSADAAIEEVTLSRCAPAGDRLRRPRGETPTFPRPQRRRPRGRGPCSRVAHGLGDQAAASVRSSNPEKLANTGKAIEGPGGHRPRGGPGAPRWTAG